MTIYFCDIEANGLLNAQNGQPPATKIHCLSWIPKGLQPRSQTKFFYQFFEDLLSNNDTVVFHNGFGYDLPLLVKLGIIKGYTPTTITLLDGTVKNVQLIDSLALSREWWPDNPKGHGLEAWAKKLGTYKPHIDDWENLPIEDYIERCEEDVLTTEQVFIYLADKLGVDYE